jgi:hypothetical protein
MKKKPVSEAQFEESDEEDTQNNGMTNFEQTLRQLGNRHNSTI